MLKFWKKDKNEDQAERAQRNLEFGMYNALSSGQRSAAGDRSEICSNAMNNNQRLAALQMIRNMNDD